jgi:tRNA pseudouridine32 synthase/23S rRNA pseudouridine746 synthase
LTVSGKHGAHSIAETVFTAISNEFPDADRMVVHRLGMDTSGLLILAKTLDAVRGLNTLFRTRTVERRYEALVCGHVPRDRGIVDLPLMRCYEYPPYVRISTEEHQEALLGLDPSVVGKQILEAPKESLTKYEVISREELGGQLVTRVTLTSLSGRTHQLNVHLAALGHPIAGDTVYGCGAAADDDFNNKLDGTAAPNGGLTDDELRYLVAHNKQRSTLEQQREAARAVHGRPQVHARSLKFRHPVWKRDIVLESETPF